MANICSSWIRLNILFILLGVSLCHHNDRCVTKDGRSGLCVPQHFCRETPKTNARIIDTCTIDDDAKDTEEHVCCPLPGQSKDSPSEVSASPRIISGYESNSGNRYIATSYPDLSPNKSTEYQKSSRSKQQSHVNTPSRNLNPVSAIPVTPTRSRIPNNEGIIGNKRTTASTTSSNGLVPNSEGCGQKPYVLFIAGGEESKAHSWPWMAAIFRRFHGSNPSKFICGGSLINNRYILTAAHCFINNRVILPASSFYIRLGSHDLDIGEDYSVESLVIHSNYTENSYVNDIALLRLSSVVYFTDKIAPLCLPYQRSLAESFVGKFAIVAGWGDKGFHDGTATRVLNEVKIPMVSNEDCALAYSRIKRMAFLMRGTNHILCAGLKEGGKDACLGDSGGPLMIKTEENRWSVIGIVSLGYKCAEPDYPGVYTRVTHYLPWIYAKMNISP